METTKKLVKPYPAELRERAVRMVREHASEHASEWAATRCCAGRRRTSRFAGSRRHLKPDKEKSSERIDGIVALILALGRALVAPPAADPGLFLSIVDTR